MITLGRHRKNGDCITCSNSKNIVFSKRQKFDNYAIFLFKSIAAEVL